MIIKPELLNKVRNYFDLNIYEAKVWVALLGKGSATAGEIAQLSGVPRSRTYDVLESLEKQGFVIQKLGKPVKYLVVKPDVVIEKLKTNVMRDAEERAELLGKMNQGTDYHDLEMLYSQGIDMIKPEEISLLLNGKSNLHSHMKDILSNAKDEVVIVTTMNALLQELRVINPILDKLDKKGVDVKIAVNAMPEEIKAVQKELKAKLKAVDLRSRFVIVDNKKILFMLSDKHDEESGISINSEFFAQSLKKLFDNASEIKSS